MDAVTVIVVVLVVVVGLMAIGGYIANRRRYDAQAGEIEQAARLADQHLAQAHAEDKGWDRSLLEQAARAAYTERTGREPGALTLVQVVDRPGIEEDEAVFDADGERLALGRSEAGWRPLA